MADTGKTTRVSRTDVGATRSFGGNMPTERTQLVERTVHQYRSKSAGLEGLNQAIASFFGQVQGALGSVQEAAYIGERQRIEQENDAQKRQAMGDALLGREMDAGLAGDLDYYDAFRSVKAQRDGYGAYQEFNQWYLEDWLPQNPTGDLMSAREEWARTNLTGSDDPDYEGQVLASFFSLTDPLVPKHQEFALKYQTAKGIENLGSAIEAKVASGTLTVGGLAQFFEQAKALDPLNEGEARSRVMSTLLASASNHPEQMMAVANLLDQPGTGMNGKSFAQSWPEEYADFQSKAVAAWNSINSVEDMKVLVDLEDRLREARTQDELVQLFVETVKFREERGAFDQTATILNNIMKAAEDFDIQEQSFQSIDRLMMGDTDGVDPADVRKNWSGWLERSFGVTNIMDMDPRTAVKAIQGLGGIAPEELTTQLSAAILDTRDQAAQAQAIQIVKALTGTSKAYAKSYLSSPAASLFETVVARTQLTSDPMEDILRQVNEARAGIASYDVPWKTLVGAPDEAASLTQVELEIDSAFKNLIGKSALLPWDNRSPKLPPALRDAALEMAHTRAVEGAAMGIDWRESVRSAVESIAVNAEVLPNSNGSLTIVPSSFFAQDAGANRGMTAYIGDDGKEAYRPRLGFNVLNPNTSREVNTVEVYEKQLADMASRHSWAFEDGEAANVSLAPSADPQVAAAGAFDVLQDQLPRIFAAGDTVTITQPAEITPWVPGSIMPVSAPSVEDRSVTITIPKDQKSMDFIFADLPQGFKFLPQGTEENRTWRLVYRPNFGDATGFSLEQQIDRFGSTTN